MTELDRLWLRWQSAQEGGAVVSPRETFDEVVGAALEAARAAGRAEAFAQVRERLDETAGPG